MDRRAVLVGATALALVLAAGCSGSGDDPAAGPDPGAAVATASPTGDDTWHSVLESGFGVAGDHAWVLVLVRNDTALTGGTVVADFSLVDGQGRELAGDSQTEAFSRPGELLALGTQVDIPPGLTPTHLGVSVTVEYPGIGPKTRFPWIPVGPVTVVADRTGGWQASAELTNPTAAVLKSPRVGVVCRNAARAIVGGGSAYPEIVPARGKVRITTVGLITTGKPASCAMYAGPAL